METFPLLSSCGQTEFLKAVHAGPICAAGDLSRQTLLTGGLQSWAIMTTMAMRKRRLISAKWPSTPGTACLCLRLPAPAHQRVRAIGVLEKSSWAMLVQVGDAVCHVTCAHLGRCWCRWVMPNYYYTTTREIPVTGQTLQLVAIDTVILDEAYARNMLLEKIEGGVLGSQVLAEFDARAHVRAHAAVEQLDWLEETLARSTADWLIVMGHYPVYSG